MDRRLLGSDAPVIAQEILGYLNFSSGAADPRFLKNLNELFGRVAVARGAGGAAWRKLADLLRSELDSLRGTCEAFRCVEQAEAVLGLVFDAALPAYRQFHRDLLFQHTGESLFQPFFIGRVCEAVLQQGGPWQQSDRIVPAALRRLNDYLGHRPVAVLRTEQKLQPYEHEWVRPIPLWIRGAGAAFGPCQEIVQAALAILDAASPSLLFDAMFSPEQLDELAVDPRAYDFDHPVNKRPNYLFGQWDLTTLDNAGRSRRFVLQQVALEAMLDRLARHGDLPHQEVLWEEAAVLAGTMLMGSGVSGDRPDAHDSNMTLGKLVQRIAVYRDAFYEQLLSRLKGSQAERLKAEALRLRQPFGAARQHFNQYLAQRRARQLQHVHLAQLFASMGYTEAARRQAEIVPVASARMSCQVRCHLTSGHRAVEGGRLEEAASQLAPAQDLLHRAIACGAMVDPWNILGFGGQYSLFPAVENSITDHRIDELLDLVSGIFSLHVEICRAATASGDTRLHETILDSLAAFARWWDKFASTEVDSVEGISGRETVASVEQVTAALRCWHEAGTAASDVAFWRRHVREFASPKAFALVIETLLDRRDPVAAMALLVQWLSQADHVPLVEEDFSFHDLALLWMEDLWGDGKAAQNRLCDDQGHPHSGIRSASASGPTPPKVPDTSSAPSSAKEVPDTVSAAEAWALARKFLDYLEANAEDYGRVPRFEMGAGDCGATDDYEESQEEGEDEDDLFGAAYEGVSYRDTTDDGVDGEMFEVGPSDSEFELVREAERIIDRLGYLATLAQLWKLTATASVGSQIAGRQEALSAWHGQASVYHRQLLELLASVQGYRIPAPRGTQDSLVEYDRRRGVKETLLEEIIDACVEMGDAARMIRASMGRRPESAGAAGWEGPAGEALAAVFRGDARAVREVLPGLLRQLRKQPLLYVALGRGGKPQRIAASRGLQYVLRRLLAYLPRLGLLTETCRLLETAQKMETEHPVGPGAITEFDRLFDIASQGIVSCLVESSAGWRSRNQAKAGGVEMELIDCLEKTIEALLRCWLSHSRGVRLSVLETVTDSRRWRSLKQFIERYGSDLFTQHFMNLGNLRGILHQGVAAYLDSLQEEPDGEASPRLLSELGSAIARDEAAYWLGVAIEAVVENYGEYVDYNSITTQSDRGEMLYTLLDFLRLRASYDRLAWNLRPVALTHEALVRAGREKASEIWRRAVAERTATIATDHLEQFQRLSKKYGMHLPSIADHLGERFVRPLEVARLCSLVRPAVEELRDGREPVAFRQLESHLAPFTTDASGAGFELPGWLEALEHEVQQAQWDGEEPDEELADLYVHLPQVRLSHREADRQVRQISNDAELW